MNVLVSLGVLVAYLYSPFATVFTPQIKTSYAAVVMLVTFVLFGHWLEMRSQGANGESRCSSLLSPQKHTSFALCVPSGCLTGALNWRPIETIAA